MVTRFVQPAVLLVEDEDKTRALYKEWLEDLKYLVIESSTKAVALMHLDRLDLHLIVLDLRLPNGHGKEVVETLVAKRDDVPVVVVTGLPDPPDFLFPVTATLRKPFPRGMFVNAVDSAMETGRSLRAIKHSTKVLRERCSRPLAAFPPVDQKPESQ